MTINFLSPSSSSTSCSISRVLNPPAIILLGVPATASAATFHHRGCLSIEIFSKARNNDRNQKLGGLASLPLQQSNRTLVQCNSTSTGVSPVNTVALKDVKLLSLFREIGIHERGTKLLLENNPDLTFRPVNTICDRIQSLEKLGIHCHKLGRLILKHPDLLTAKEIDSFVHFVTVDLESKIEPLKLEHLFNTTDPRFFVGFEGNVKLLLHHGVPQEKLAHVLNNVNLAKALCLKSAEELERTIIFLNRFGGVDFIIRRPVILNYDLDGQLIPRFMYLYELSEKDEDATATVFRKVPGVLTYTVDHLKDHVEFLRSFAGLTNQEIFRIVLLYPNVFSASRKRKLHPRLDFLKQCGLNSRDIFKFLTKAPLFLTLSFDKNLAYKLVFLVKIGYKNRTKDLARAMGAITRISCKNFQQVIGLYLNYGLTCNDILIMSKKHPQVLQYNHESLEEKMDYLIEDMGREVRELLGFPAFLGYKLDTRIKFRYEERKKVSGEGMSISKLLCVSAEKFRLKKKKKSPLL
ncbi:hypothetical protein RHSIM_Rhsim09G0209500 [Rhododendron simsii]|uniref:Uncharacterized protein n=1 Tax=Rhododendron simsii TaxID=118357 RepID=A0A834LE70_RHOSS|nr:hypothetical protein RHSIM_Rhsim09G0209500 [Rhododendron simsii]